MDMFEELLGSLVKNYQLKQDEFVGDDGLVYCKLCHTPRQQYIRCGEKQQLVFVKCKCETEKSDRYEYEMEQFAMRQRLEIARMEAIPVESYRKYNFSKDDGLTPKTAEIAKNYVRNFEQFSATGQGLLLYGDVGTGKTFYAMCIANALIDMGYVVKQTSLAEIVNQAQNFETAETTLNRLLSCHCVILDDLGTERTTTFAKEKVYQFIDGCNTRNVALVITTNYTPKEIEAASNDTSDLMYARIYSRILEKCYPVKVNEVKRRAENARKNKQNVAKLLGVEK